MITEPEKPTTGPAGRADPAAEIREASSRIRVGAYAEAEQKLLAVLDLHPGQEGAWYWLGLARFKRRDFAGAEEAFASLLRLQPAHPEGQYGLGVSLYEQGRLDAAGAAIENALRLRPDFAEAERKLRDIRAQAAAGAPRQPSLAETLDVRRGPLPDDETMAGEVRWAGRPSALALIPPAVLAVVVVLAPQALRALVESLPPGPARASMATVWRLAEALALPIALVLITLAAALWFTTLYTLRDRRLEIQRGVLRRRHMVLWFYELERQPIVEQTLIDTLLGLASIVLVTNALLDSKTAQRSNLGRLQLQGLDEARAFEVAASLRQRMLPERRRMVNTWMASR
jgi:tetratricopeptide (TPR) repeat protein